MTAQARREALTELDALTDQIAPLLRRMATTWRRVELDLSGRRKQVTTCPCGAPVPGLLVDSCRTCTPAAIAADVALDLSCEE